MEMIKKLAFILAIIAIVIMTVFITLYMSDTGLQKAIVEELSQNLGDFMCGTIGILLSFVSTLFLFLSFNSQHKQFEETHKDNYRARFEGTFFNMLAMYYSVRNEGDKQVSQFSKSKSKSLKEFYIQFKSYYTDALNKEKSLKNSMSSLERKDIQISELDTAKYDLGNLFDSYIKEQRCNPGFYFRYIHNLITFVIEHWKYSSNDIHKYLNFIQAQMADEELGLIFYDSMSNQGQDKKHEYTFKQNLDNYSFLENIPESTLIMRNHYKFFPKTMFIFLNEDERERQRKNL